MNYDDPNITIEEPVPGYVILSGYPAQSHFVEGVGHYVAPKTCIIPPGVPAALLRAVAAAREVNVAAVQGGDDASELAVSLNVRVLGVLAEGNIKLTKLAERLGVTTAELKAVDAASGDWYVAQGGWVKLGKKEGEV